MRHFPILAAAAAILAGCGSGSGSGFGFGDGAGRSAPDIRFVEQYAYTYEPPIPSLASAYPVEVREPIVRFPDISATVRATVWLRSDDMFSVDLHADGGSLEVYLADHPRADLLMNFRDGTEVSEQPIDELRLYDIRVDVHRETSTDVDIDPDTWYAAAGDEVRDWEGKVYGLYEQNLEAIFHEARGTVRASDQNGEYSEGGGDILAVGTIYYSAHRGLGYARMHTHVGSSDEGETNGTYSPDGWVYPGGWSLDVEVEARGVEVEAR